MSGVGAGVGDGTDADVVVPGTGVSVTGTGVSVGSTVSGVAASAEQPARTRPKRLNRSNVDTRIIVLLFTLLALMT
jgi:hypothetical protein